MTSNGNEQPPAGDEDFATLFEASLRAPRIEPGQTIEGTLVAIGADTAFVDVGGKGEATIALEELRTEDGALEAAVGDRIQAVVISTAGGVVLSRRLARGAATLRQLEQAFHAGLPVEGRVEKAIKGGYEVRLAQQRAFCPASQIDLARGVDPAAYEGQVFTFRIIEFRDEGRTMVVSRRPLLEDAQRASAAEVRQTIVPGAVIAGRVTSVVPFGAFVDLGAGVQGLLHVSEMSWTRVADAASVVAPGQALTVKVLRVEVDGQKIALGLKQLLDDPWATAATTYAPGQVRSGRVTRLAEFGAFVELEPGIEALAHASGFPPTGTPRGWARRVPVGTVGDFEILTVEPEKKRIGVALVIDGRTRGDRAAASAAERQTADLDSREADAVRARVAGTDAGSRGLGSLADQLKDVWGNKTR